MTDNADLIAEARDVLSRPIRADHESEEARGVIQRLVYALEATEHRATEYAAVVEKVRAWADRNKGMGYGTGTGASALEILDILATAPADALRERDAEKWDEGDAARRMYVENRRAGRNVTMPRNPYRAREEQS